MQPSHDERSRWTTAARHWFEALDHKAINVGGRHWVIQVVGIHGDLPHFWIQLESMNDSKRGLLLRVTAGTSVDNVLAAVSAAWRGEKVQGRIECAPVVVQNSTATW